MKVWEKAKWFRCNWHLNQNLVARFSKYSKKWGDNEKSILATLKEWLQSDTPQDLNDIYVKKLQGKFGPKDNVYLQKLMDAKEEWSRAFVKEYFMANTLTTNRCESFTASSNEALEFKARYVI